MRTLYYMLRGQWEAGFRPVFEISLLRGYYDGEWWQLSLGWVWIFNRY